MRSACTTAAYVIARGQLTLLLLAQTLARGTSESLRRRKFNACLLACKLIIALVTRMKKELPGGSDPELARLEAHAADRERRCFHVDLFIVATGRVRGVLAHGSISQYPFKSHTHLGA